MCSSDLIGRLHFGVGAAALATVISQFVSVVLCLRQLLHSPEEFRLSPGELRIDRDMLRQLLNSGLPAGFQNSIISVANVFVQANINGFGQMAVAGCGAYSKIQGFVFLPITCFSLALTTFISQNLGAKKYDRVRKGALFGIFCTVVGAELIGVLIYIFAPNLIAAFNHTPEVIAVGTEQARTEAFFFFLLAFSHCMAGILRGAGKSVVPMIVMLIFWCIFRVGYITIAVRFIPAIRVIFWAYPLTWSLSSLTFLIYYKKCAKNL